MSALDPLLVLNAGSSSLKFSIFSDEPELAPAAHGEVSGLGEHAQLSVRDAAGNELIRRGLERNDHDGAFAAIESWYRSHTQGRFGAVGHRIVHGGSKFVAPVRIDTQVLSELQQLVALAPLHQPHQLAAVRAVRAAAPQVPQVACFDTAFHAQQAPLARHYALPRALTDAGIVRYGFHGLSYEYIVSTLPQYLSASERARVVVAHLGNGASMCAISDARSVATTMGLTPVDGLPMGTRSGALDPGAVLYLQQSRGMDLATIQDLLYNRCGLLGVSGISADMRTLLASGQAQAREAIDLFVYRIGRELGSLAAALGGLDALIFTGGIGENAPSIRAAVCAGARWLGVTLDEAANQRGSDCISSAGSRPSAWVVPTNENLVVARHVRALLRR